MAHNRSKPGAKLVSAWVSARAELQRMGDMLLSDVGGCKEAGSSQTSGREGSSSDSMKTVSVTLQVDYTEKEMPNVVQTLIWQTYDTSPKFPRVVSQVNEIANREGTVIKNWLISTKGELGPKQTHDLQSYTAN